MFWIFMMIAGGAATFTQLGMYAAWIKILTMALFAAALVISGLTATLLWRGISSKNNRSGDMPASRISRGVNHGDD